MRLLTILLIATFAPAASADKAVFAGGCFWCMEAAYQDLKGVSDVISGFTGGKLKNPTYNGNHRGHFEAVEVTYDPNVISYKILIEHFWHNIDPFDDRGQFCDKGSSYRSAIFPVDDEQKLTASVSLRAVQTQFPEQPVATEIQDASRFWPVEGVPSGLLQEKPHPLSFLQIRLRPRQPLETDLGRQKRVIDGDRHRLLVLAPCPTRKVQQGTPQGTFSKERNNGYQ